MDLQVFLSFHSPPGSQLLLQSKLQHANSLLMLRPSVSLRDRQSLTCRCTNCPQVLFTQPDLYCLRSTVWMQQCTHYPSDQPPHNPSWRDPQNILLTKIYTKAISPVLFHKIAIVIVVALFCMDFLFCNQNWRCCAKIF